MAWRAKLLASCQMRGPDSQGIPGGQIHIQEATLQDMAPTMHVLYMPLKPAPHQCHAASTPPGIGISAAGQRLGCLALTSTVLRAVLQLVEASDEPNYQQAFHRSRYLMQVPAHLFT